jgi:hypothetical protein
VMLGGWLAGEHFSTTDIAAMAVILAGVVAITLAKARASNKPASSTPASSTPEPTEESQA